MKNPNSSKKSTIAKCGKSQEISNECLPLDGSKGEIVLLNLHIKKGLLTLKCPRKLLPLWPD